MANTIQALSHSLEQMDQECWDNLRLRAKGNHLWHKLEWWHNKYYQDNPPNDGDFPQQPQCGNPAEVPHQRNLFYPSAPSRFSLGRDEAVAYFSSDFSLNCCETIEQFNSNSRLPFKEISEYLDGQGNPTPGWCGHPLNFHLVSGTIILDVSANANSFLVALSNAGKVSSDIIWQCFKSRNSEEKQATQRVSREAKRMGFDGLLYASVRKPVDVSLLGMNLVMFNQEKVMPGLPPLPQTVKRRQNWEKREEDI